MKDPALGDVMKDGTIFIGVSPDTKRAIYAAPHDAPKAMTFNEAAAYAKKFNKHGRNDWRVATFRELQLIRENSEEGALKGTFNFKAADEKGTYGSSSAYLSHNAYGVRFYDGQLSLLNKTLKSSIRLVRGDGAPKA